MPMKPLPKTRRAPVGQSILGNHRVGVGRSSGEAAFRVLGLGPFRIQIWGFIKVWVFGDNSSVRGMRVSHDARRQHVISIRVCLVTVKLL